MNEFKIPGGDHRGTPLNQAPMSALTYWATRIGDSLNQGTSKYPDKDKRLHHALCAEISRREGGGKQEAPAPASNTQAPAGTNIVTRKADELAGSYSKPDDVMRMLREAAQLGYLVSPQTACGELPPGCVIATSLVWIDADKETYGIPNSESPERGLDKTALAKISAAAGIDWDPILTCRLDNGRDPHYVHFRAVGHVKNFDGTVRTEKGEVEQDFREGSADATITATDEKRIESAKKDIALKRKFILRHAESKAMNRVIRRLGLRSKYHRTELQKPFIVAKIMFTGHTDDPALKQMFAGKIADSFMGGHQQLYPGQRHATPGHSHHQMPASTPQHDPPPVGESAADDDDYSYLDGDTVPGELTAGAPSTAVNVTPQRQPEPAQQGSEPKQAKLY